MLATWRPCEWLAVLDASIEYNEVRRAMQGVDCKRVAQVWLMAGEPVARSSQRRNALLQSLKRAADNKQGEASGQAGKGQRNTLASPSAGDYCDVALARPSPFALPPRDRIQFFSCISRH